MFILKVFKAFAMQRWVYKSLLTVIMSAGIYSFCWAELLPDYEREARLIAEAEAGLFDGEVIYLQASSRQVFALLNEPGNDRPDGALILLHGRGFHPDWPQVVGPLREKFAENMVSTLSVQMPVLAKDAKYYDYLKIIPESFTRIEAAVNYLREKGYRWIGVIAHSCSVHMTMAWFKDSGDGMIDAYVGIGMGATDYRQPMLEPFPIEAMTVPVLDVYGDQDYPAVTNKAEERLVAIRSAGHPHSSQVSIEGADHFFEDYEDELFEAVSGWVLERMQDESLSIN